MSDEKTTKIVGTEDPTKRVVVTTKQELLDEESGKLQYSYVLVGLCIFIAAGIGWKLHGISGLQIGAILGFGFTLLFKFGREVLFHTILIIVALAILWGLYIFGSWVFGVV